MLLFVVRFSSVTREVVDALLSKDEAALPFGIKGIPEFDRDYASEALKSRDGKSLRDLTVRRHLYRYRCSPLIYARTFEAMPKELRTVVLRRLSVGLRAAQPAPEFAHLPADERQAIHEILTATLPELPADWGK